MSKEQERIKFTWTTNGFNAKQISEEMNITVNNSEQGLRLVARMKPSNSIRDIKDLIERKEQIDVLHQKLVYKGQELENGKQLSQYNIENGAVIHLAILSRKRLRPKPYLFIQSMDGKVVEMNFAPDDTIYDIKQRIQDQKGTPIDQQRLKYAGKQLEDDQTLAHYNVSSCATFHLVLRLRGC